MCMGYHYTTSFDVYGDSLSYFLWIFLNIEQINKTVNLQISSPVIRSSVFLLQLIRLLIQTVNTAPVFLISI